MLLAFLHSSYPQPVASLARSTTMTAWCLATLPTGWSWKRTSSSCGKRPIQSAGYARWTYSSRRKGERSLPLTNTTGFNRSTGRSARPSSNYLNINRMKTLRNLHRPISQIRSWRISNLRSTTTCTSKLDSEDECQFLKDLISRQPQGIKSS